MSQTQAIIGFGTLFKFGDGASPEVFTTVAEVTNIDGPGLSRAIPEATHMESPNGYREYIGGLKDGEEVTLECNFLPGNATQDPDDGILSLFESGIRTNFQIVWPFSPTVTWQFAGVVTGFQPTTPVDDKITISVTIKVTGQPDFTGGA